MGLLLEKSITSSQLEHFSETSAEESFSKKAIWIPHEPVIPPHTADITVKLKMREVHHIKVGNYCGLCTQRIDNDSAYCQVRPCISYAFPSFPWSFLKKWQRWPLKSFCFKTADNIHFHEALHKAGIFIYKDQSCSSFRLASYCKQAKQSELQTNTSDLATPKWAGLALQATEITCY